VVRMIVRLITYPKYWFFRHVHTATCPEPS